MADMEITVGMKVDELERGLRTLSEKMAQTGKTIESTLKFGLAAKGFKQFSTIAMQGLHDIEKDSYAAQRALRFLDTGFSSSVGREFAFAIAELERFVEANRGGAKTVAGFWEKYIVNGAAGQAGGSAMDYAAYLTPGLGIYAAGKNIYKGITNKDTPEFAQMIEADKADAQAKKVTQFGDKLKEQRETLRFQLALNGTEDDYEKRRMRAYEEYRKANAQLQADADGLGLSDEYILDNRKALLGVLQQEVALSRSDESKKYAKDITDNMTAAFEGQQAFNADKLSHSQDLEDRALAMRDRALSIEQLKTGETEALAEKKAILDYEKEILDIQRDQTLTEEERNRLQAERSYQLGQELDATKGYWARKDQDKQMSYRSLSGLSAGAGQASTLRQVFGSSGGGGAATVAGKQLTALEKIAKNTDPRNQKTGATWN